MKKIGLILTFTAVSVMALGLLNPQVQAEERIGIDIQNERIQELRNSGGLDISRQGNNNTSSLGDFMTNQRQENIDFLKQQSAETRDFLKTPKEERTQTLQEFRKAQSAETKAFANTQQAETLAEIQKLFPKK